MKASLDMARSNLKGIYNFCNPGAISHHEVLDMYKEIIDPNFRYTGFSVSEQDKILAAKRSNNELDATKLKEALSKIKANPVPEVHEAYRNCFERMKKKLVAEVSGRLCKNSYGFCIIAYEILACITFTVVWK